MSKPYFNPKILPGISNTGRFPETDTPRVFYHNPLKESVGRLEEQNLEALGALTQLNQLVTELVEINHTETKKMDQLAKVQDILLEEQHEAKKDRQTQLEIMEKSQSSVKDHQQETKDHLQMLLEKVQQGSDQVQGLKDAFQSEALGDRLTGIANLIQALIGKQDKENASVLEAAGLQNLLLEEIARKQAEFEKGQTKGFKRILEKLNLIKSENDKSHDTQLENQKLLVDSLYKLVNEQKVIEEVKEFTME